MDVVRSAFLTVSGLFYGMVLTVLILAAILDYFGLNIFPRSYVWILFNNWIVWIAGLGFMSFGAHSLNWVPAHGEIVVPGIADDPIAEKMAAGAVAAALLCILPTILLAVYVFNTFDFGLDSVHPMSGSLGGAD